jgi:hypothetical protein
VRVVHFLHLLLKDPLGPTQTGLNDGGRLEHTVSSFMGFSSGERWNVVRWLFYQFAHQLF